jgi:tetratricopeptide (TPR) repeat protein
VHALLGQTEQAIAVYEQARQVWPEHPDSWRLTGALAQLYANLGQIEPALAYARQALETAPAEQQTQIRQLIEQLGGAP